MAINCEGAVGEQVFYMSVGVREAENFFSLLAQGEQQLLVSKLLALVSRADFTPDDFELAAQRFQTLILTENQSRNPTDKFLTLQNFTRQLGQNPAAWGQVNSIIGVAQSYLEMTVNDHRQFLAALKAAGYAVNSWMEKISRWVGQGHRFDSARARTEHRFEPQLHLVNDRADEAAFGPNYFFVHWDAQSVFAKRSSLLSRLAAGRTHKHQTATPQEVKAYLDQMRWRI